MCIVGSRELETATGFQKQGNNYFSCNNQHCNKNKGTTSQGWSLLVILEEAGV